MATRAAIIKMPMIANWEKVIALPTFPVCEEPLILTKANITIMDMEFGWHQWNVTCWDPFNNSNTSLTYNFYVNAPDLFVNAVVLVAVTLPTESACGAHLLFPESHLRTSPFVGADV